MLEDLSEQEEGKKGSFLLHPGPCTRALIGSEGWSLGGRTLNTQAQIQEP